MRFLELGLGLLKAYQFELRSQQTIDSADLRLTLYALEVALLHQHKQEDGFATANGPGMENVLLSLVDLRSNAVRSESGDIYDGRFADSLEIAIHDLESYLDQRGGLRPTPPQRTPPAPLSESLKISRTILDQLSALRDVKREA